MSYLKIAEYYDNCFKQHGDSNLGVDWPNYEDTLTRHQVMYEIIKKENSTLLDFGCGLGHFNEWLVNNDKQIQYSGLDINEGFYNTCKSKFPNLSFYNIDIFKENNLPNFDYITINGVSNHQHSIATQGGDDPHNDMQPTLFMGNTFIYCGKHHKGAPPLLSSGYYYV
jgi:2-polyprenyl-3-methyl-5-hydroxy-6-metoxy-1,4-benzoquinol methylase